MVETRGTKMAHCSD
jgi:hypothetical protein